MLDMRVCDFIKKINGNYIIKVHTDNETVIKEGKIRDLEEECRKSFNPLEGFNDILWGKDVKDWVIKENIVYVLVSKHN